MADSWLNMEISLERQLTLEGLRREAAHMHHHELAAQHDFLLRHHMHTAHMLEQAMRRICELELREAMTVGSDHMAWARELREELGQ